MTNLLGSNDMLETQQDSDITSSGFIYLGFYVHCTGHITTGGWKGRGNQYIQLVRVLYCKLPTNGKQLPALQLEAVPGTEPGLRGGRRECYHSATMAPYIIRKRTRLLWENVGAHTRSFHHLQPDSPSTSAQMVLGMPS